MYESFKVVQAELNFSYEMVEPTTKEADDSDHWTGQILMLQQGQADFSIMNMAILDSRAAVVLFLQNNTWYWKLKWPLIQVTFVGSRFCEKQNLPGPI